MKALTVIVVAAGACLVASGTVARERHGSAGGGVPELDIKGSCSDAQKFSSGSDNKNSAYKGCMQDEMNAKSELAKRWSSFNGKDRQNCVDQSRQPSPSYVEVLTCLEMDTDAMRNAPKVDGRPVPQIGGPVAPGLPAPGTAAPSAAPPVIH